jgi:hypothetical protein
MPRLLAAFCLSFSLSGCIGTAVGITKDVVVGTASIATDVVVGTVDITTDVIGLAIPGGGEDE